jgi:hypothetical protein
MGVGAVRVMRVAGAVSTRENEDIFLRDVRGGGYVGVKKSRKGRAP